MIDLFCRPLSDGSIEYQIDNRIIGKNPQVIIDAGANIGLFTLLYLNKFPQAQFICVEPDQENYKVLKQNVKSYSNVKCVLGGLWNKDCYLKINDRGTGEWGFVVEEVSRDECVCKGYGLTSLMNMIPTEKIDICKIDIEGSEDDVFSENYEDWIERIDCYMVEVHDRIKPGVENKILKLLTCYGYKYIYNGENIVFYREKHE